MRMTNRWCLIVAAAAVFGAGCATGPAHQAPDFAAIVAAPDRNEADRANDKRRRPQELYAYTGVRPGMKVLDLWSGGGYSAELLARAIAPSGVLYAHDFPNSFPKSREIFARRMETPAMKNVVRIERPFEDPAPPGMRDFDVITFFFNYHDTVHMGVDRTKMNRALFAALKPGGTLIVADHSARPGEGTSVTKTHHRIEESVVRKELESAGFQYVGEGGFLRNPQDTRETPVSKNTVPNDEFVLKFRKPG
jgi:predicted methyltransferase